MKKYKSDIRFFYNKIYNNEKFALAKFGDGEWAAIQGNKLSAAKGEWTLNPEDSSHLIAQKKLITDYNEPKVLKTSYYSMCVNINYKKIIEKLDAAKNFIDSV